MGSFVKGGRVAVEIGARALNEPDIAQDLFQRQTLMGWSFDIELLYLARRKKLRIKEIPIQWYFDADSKVKAIKDALRMIGDIFRIHINAMHGRYGLKS